MGKDKVVIAIVVIVVISAILFGTFMAYRIYRLPLRVEDIDEAINILKGTTERGYPLVIRLSMFNELSRSNKMRDKDTNEIRKFTDEEMIEFYNCIGGKDAILYYLNNIEDREIKQKEAEDACYSFKVITDDDLIEILE